MRAEPLERPEPADLPPIAYDLAGNHRPPSFRYKKQVDICRQFPGQWFKIGFFRDTSPAKTARSCLPHKFNLRRALDRHYPMELWELAVRRDVATWADRYLWARFVKVMTEEEAAAEKARRKEVYDKQFTAQEGRRGRRTARQASEHVKALEQERQSGAGQG
jgi:hypothetical protein